MTRSGTPVNGNGLDSCRLVRQGEKICGLDERAPRPTRPLPACWQVREIFRLSRSATEPDNLVHLPDEPAGVRGLGRPTSSWQSHSPAGRAGRGLVCSRVCGRMEYLF